jgi:hypothetical protein
LNQTAQLQSGFIGGSDSFKLRVATYNRRDRSALAFLISFRSLRLPFARRHLQTEAILERDRVPLRGLNLSVQFP